MYVDSFIVNGVVEATDEYIALEEWYPIDIDTEVADALAKNKPEELKDGIGDVVVTLIILAQQNVLTLDECLETAYNEIADRKGKTVNGVFVKEEDL